MRPLIATHCGAGSRRELDGLARKAGEAGRRVLSRGGSALDAVLAATVVLENDPRTNAGTGSRMRLDGTIQMDAAVMDSDRRAGAVAAISNVRNPILVARKVLETPHVLLAGPWATRFARAAGVPFYDPSTDDARQRLAETRAAMARGKLPEWAAAWRRHEATDTVGAVARDREGRYAAGNSTGGVTYMLPGRVGDSPIVGAGLYAGPAGAVTATGVGEEIIRLALCKHVYDRLEPRGAQRACEEGLALFPRTVPMGILAVDGDRVGEASNRDMAWWASGRRGRPGTVRRNG